MSSTELADAPVVDDAAKTYGFRDVAREYVERVRGGELGSLPAVLGLVSLVSIFTVLQGRTFFSTFNFANLLSQGAMIIVLAMGLVFVLLLGEIDLSAGFAAGTGGAVLGVTLTREGWPLPLALLTCLVTGIAIGIFIGVLVAKLGIPSFVVTLAMFLALQGLMLLIIGVGGTIGIQSDFVRSLQTKNLAPWLGWVLAVVTVGGFAAITGLRMVRRRAGGLTAEPVTVWATKVASLAVIAGVATFFLNRERSKNPDITSIRGVPYIVPVLLVLLVVGAFILTRTAFGRHVYAVGGNPEAARRAGIDVARIRIVCFAICSLLAAVAGILYASRDGSISPSTGGSTTLLYAVGAAVIGGTSLFGGRGRIWDALVGGLVIAVIDNGLPLITQRPGIQFVVTGAVLLVAASVDALSRRKSILTT